MVEMFSIEQLFVFTNELMDSINKILITRISNLLALVSGCMPKISILDIMVEMFSIQH